MNEKKDNCKGTYENKGHEKDRHMKKQFGIT